MGDKKVTATVWYDRLESVWHIHTSDGKKAKLPAKATTTDLQKKCKQLGIEPQNVYFS